MTAVDQLKDRFIEMLDQGLTRFGFTVGPAWHSLTIEEKAAEILKTWDAPRKLLDFNDSYAPTRSSIPSRDVREIVSEIEGKI